MVVGFARLGGRVIGLVANNPRFMGGCLDIIKFALLWVFRYWLATI